MKVQRGDVVIISHPFSDAMGAKVRPALVVQADRRNALLNHTIVAMITKNISRTSLDPTQLLIDVATSDGRASGLKVNSAVTCGNLFTIHENLLRQKIGALSTGLMQQVDTCLKAALELN
jgi:mRNA interferase MazF